jgi:hypothetical protein
VPSVNHNQGIRISLPALVDQTRTCSEASYQRPLKLTREEWVNFGR